MLSYMSPPLHKALVNNLKHAIILCHYRDALLGGPCALMYTVVYNHSKLDDNLMEILMLVDGKTTGVSIFNMT